jgi:hypothetical protein
MSYIIRAYLCRTEVKQYVIQVFGPIPNKFYDFNALPLSVKNNLLRNLLNKEAVEPLKAYEVMIFSEALLNSIIESLVFIPSSVRYLLKTIKQFAIEKVVQQITVRFLKVKLRVDKSLLTSYSITGGFLYYLKLKNME